MYWAENDRRIDRYLSSSVITLSCDIGSIIYVILSVFVDRHHLSGHLSRPCQIILFSLLIFLGGSRERAALVTRVHALSIGGSAAMPEAGLRASLCKFCPMNFPGFPSKRHKKSFGGGSMGPGNLTGEKWIPKKRTKVKGVSRVYWPHFWFMLWSVLVLSSPSSPPMCSTPGESTETSWIWPQDGALLCKLQAEPPKEPRKEKGQKWDW